MGYDVYVAYSDVRALAPSTFGGPALGARVGYRGEGRNQISSPSSPLAAFLAAAIRALVRYALGRFHRDERLPNPLPVLAQLASLQSPPSNRKAPAIVAFGRGLSCPDHGREPARILAPFIQKERSAGVNDHEKARPAVPSPYVPAGGTFAMSGAVSRASSTATIVTEAIAIIRTDTAQVPPPLISTIAVATNGTSPPPIGAAIW